MVKKIIHIGDIHIRTNDRHEEYKKVFDNFFDKLEQEYNDYDKDELRIAILGDLVHQKINVSNEQFILCREFLIRCSNFCKTIIIPGNHDMLLGNLDRLDSIYPIVNSIDNPDLTYISKTSFIIDDNLVWVNYGITDEEVIDIKKIRETYTDKKIIGMYHGVLNGALLDNGFELTSEVKGDRFYGVDVMLLGDIHKYQIIEKEGFNAVYCGSLIQQNYGENINNHGYVEWDVTNMEHRLIEIDNDYVYLTFHITSPLDIEDDTELIANV